MTSAPAAHSVLKTAMASGDTRQARRRSAWSLGAVLAEREVDEHTWLLVVRADAGLPPSLAVGRKLTRLRMAGYTTIVVNLVDGDRLSDPLLATLLEWRRKLELRDGRLVIAAEHPAARAKLGRAGLELADL
jgi:hypothetical protein